jgi:tripeptide aminopeptidase
LVNRERLLETFFELVKTDSETKEERQICDLLKQKWTELGFHVVEDDAAEKTGHGAGNLVATLEGTVKDAPVVYFTCHMDTVKPGKGVKPSIQDGYVVSDGTTILGSDDKAGIAALFEGIRLIREQGIDHGTIQLVITVGEESGLVGAKALDRSLLKADFGFALDSNGPVGEIITSAPSQYHIKATIYGKAAHAGVNPEDGISAIQVASRAISKMPLGRIDEETTANIGMFRGGTATNVVAEHAEIVAEARSRDEAKLETQVKKMVQAFEEAAREAGARVEVETEKMYPAYKYDESHPVVQTAIAAVKKVGRDPKILASGGGSDANVISGYGVPTVNLGIGYENIHSTSERMPIAELEKAAELVVSIIQTVAEKR